MSSLPPPIPYQTPPSLGPEVQQQLLAAQLRAKKLRNCAKVANTDAGTLALFAVLSLLCDLIDRSAGFSGIALALLLGVVSFLEFRAIHRFKRLDPQATKALVLNQIILAAGLIAYAGWRWYAESRAGGGLPADLKPYEKDLGDMAKDIEGIGQTVTQVLYASMILIAIFGQGGLALYYHTREKFLKAYITETPAWIQEMQRAGGPL